MTPKAQLLARVATERAALWGHLLGLDETALTGLPVTGDWTAKDIIAHVAAWDDIHARRIALLLAGRAGEIERVERDPLNARLQTEHSAWTLDEAVGAAQEARASFLRLVEPLSWEDMTRAHETAAAERFTIQFLTERRYRHDAVHTAEILAWRRSHPAQAASGPRSILLAALDSARSALLAWGRLVPADQRSTRPVCGEWTWQAVIGHVADWEDWYVRGLREMAAGRPGGADFDGDEEGWNRRHATARRGQPFAATWEHLADTRWALLGLLDGTDDAGLAQDVPTPFRSMACRYAWFAGPAQHDLEHAEALQAMLASA